MKIINYSKHLFSMALMFIATNAWSDSISPSTYSTTLDVGESVTISKTVTVSAGTPTSAKVDVFFLADTTGSMVSQISAVKNAASTIMSNVSGLGDVSFAVGEYKDFTDSFAYRLNSDVTSSTIDTQTGINAWSASGGGDFAEANLFALENAATETSWRTDSTRILVWFGDAPGHDPSGGSTEASAISALTGNNITVHALDSSSLDYSGQATRIADATGGSYDTFGSTAPADVAAKISSAIISTFAEYSAVSLGISGAHDGVDVSWSPSSISGSFDRSIDRTFDFDVTFTGTKAGSYDFGINALVDGGIIATESDSITVSGVSPVPVPPALWLFMGGLGLLGTFRKCNSQHINLVAA